MKLLPNEERLVSSNGDKIILTDHRIQMTDRAWGHSFTISMFLENISSIEIKYRSNTLLLVLGIVITLGGVYMGGQFHGSQPLAVGIALGGSFLLGWWFSRKHVISISSNGGSPLNFEVQGMSEEEINHFVYRVSLAKRERVQRIGLR